MGRQLEFSEVFGLSFLDWLNVSWVAREYMTETETPMGPQLTLVSYGHWCLHYDGVIIPGTIYSETNSKIMIPVEKFVWWPRGGRITRKIDNRAYDVPRIGNVGGGDSPSCDINVRDWMTANG